MKIGRKEAILAFIAAVIPFVGRRANAQVQRLPPTGLIGPKVLAPQVSPEVADLQKRVAALEAFLATQVAFTRQGNGDLVLHHPTTTVRIEAGNIICRSGDQVELLSGGKTWVKGSSVSIN